MSFCDYLENALLNHIFKGSAYTSPTVYVGLSTTTPTDAGGSFTEPSGGAYARVTTATTDWMTSTAGATANSTSISFAQATASWGTITHFGLFDAASGGNCLATGALTTTKSVGSGDTASFAVGDLDVTQD